VAAPAPAEFSAQRYQTLVDYLRAQGHTIPATAARHIDGELVLPKPFRVALAEFLGHGFRGNHIVVAPDGRLQLTIAEPEPHQYVADFSCRHPGFKIQWRPGLQGDFGVVAVTTETAACIADRGNAVGTLLWRVPKGRDLNIADALGLLREVFVQGK
jgi:hypothetical protein